MQQIFTKDFIFERLKDGKTPFWTLGLCQGFKNVANVLNYNGIDFEDEDTDETKIDKSIAQLANTIASFPTESIFVIEMRPSMTASRSSIVGPFQFVNSNEKTKSELTAAPTPQLGAVPPGYVPESMLKGLQDSMQSTFDAKIKALQEEQRLQRQEDEYQRKLEKLEEAQKEVREMKKSYESTVAKGTDILLGVVQRLGTMFLMPKDANATAAMMAAQQQLGATQQQSEPDPKADAVDDVATYIYKNLSVEEIEQLKSYIMSKQNGNTEMEKTDR